MDIVRGSSPFAPAVSGVVPIGEKLTIALYIRDRDDSFDLHVKDCYAYDSPNYDKPGTRSIQLTDSRGCTVREKLIKGFFKTRNGRSTGATAIAYGVMSAFKFPEKMDVYISCMVEICKGRCDNVCQLEESKPDSRPDVVSEEQEHGKKGSQQHENKHEGEERQENEQEEQEEQERQQVLQQEEERRLRRQQLLRDIQRLSSTSTTTVRTTIASKTSQTERLLTESESKAESKATASVQGEKEQNVPQIIEGDNLTSQQIVQLQVAKPLVQLNAETNRNSLQPQILVVQEHDIPSRDLVEAQTAESVQTHLDKEVPQLQNIQLNQIKRDIIPTTTETLITSITTSSVSESSTTDIPSLPAEELGFAHKLRETDGLSEVKLTEMPLEPPTLASARAPRRHPDHESFQAFHFDSNRLSERHRRSLVHGDRNATLPLGSSFVVVSPTEDLDEEDFKKWSYLPNDTVCVSAAGVLCIGLMVCCVLALLMALGVIMSNRLRKNIFACKAREHRDYIVGDLCSIASSVT